MSTLIIRNFPDDAHTALKVMAANQLGRRGSVEGLARNLLVEAAKLKGPGLGTRFAAISAELRADLEAAGESFTNEEVDSIFKRSAEQAEPAKFE
jgi:plasmid stability protein